MIRDIPHPHSARYGRLAFITLLALLAAPQAFASPPPLQEELGTIAPISHHWKATEQLLSFGDEVVAVVVLPEDAGRAVYATRDGASWELLGPAPDTGEARIAQGNGWRLVALRSRMEGGASYLPGAAWRRADNGAWEAVTLPEYNFNGGYLLGHDGTQFLLATNNPQQRLLVSPDGADWSPSMAERLAGHDLIAYHGGRYWGVATSGLPPRRVRTLAAGEDTWTTTDLTSREVDRARLATTPQGTPGQWYLEVSSSSLRPEAFLMSTDGVTWTAADAAVTGVAMQAGTVLVAIGAEQVTWINNEAAPVDVPRPLPTKASHLTVLGSGLLALHDVGFYARRDMATEGWNAWTPPDLPMGAIVALEGARGNRMAVTDDGYRHTYVPRDAMNASAPRAGGYWLRAPEALPGELLDFVVLGVEQGEPDPEAHGWFALVRDDPQATVHTVYSSLHGPESWPAAEAQRLRAETVLPERDSRVWLLGADDDDGIAREINPVDGFEESPVLRFPATGPVLALTRDGLGPDAVVVTAAGVYEWYRRDEPRFVVALPEDRTFVSLRPDALEMEMLFTNAAGLYEVWHYTSLAQGGNGPTRWTQGRTLSASLAEPRLVNVRMEPWLVTGANGAVAHTWDSEPGQQLSFPDLVGRFHPWGESFGNWPSFPYPAAKVAGVDAEGFVRVYQIDLRDNRQYQLHWGWNRVEWQTSDFFLPVAVSGTAAYAPAPYWPVFYNYATESWVYHIWYTLPEPPWQEAWIYDFAAEAWSQVDSPFYF